MKKKQNKDLRLILRILVGVATIIIFTVSGMNCSTINRKAVIEVADDVVDLIESIDKLDEEELECVAPKKAKPKPRRNRKEDA